MMDMKPTPSQIDLKINAANVSIAEVAQLAADFGTAFSPGMNIGGQLTADIHAQGAANQPAMNGRLEGHNLEISGNRIVRNALKRTPPKRGGIVLAGGQDGGAGTLLLRGNVIRANGGPGILETHFRLVVDASGNDVGGNED